MAHMGITDMLYCYDIFGHGTIAKSGLIRTMGRVWSNTGGTKQAALNRRRWSDLVTRDTDV